VNRDPIGYASGTNIYSYCGEGPVGNSDSEGHRTTWVTWAVGLVCFACGVTFIWTGEPDGSDSNGAVVLEGGLQGIVNPNGNIITPLPGVRLSPNPATTDGYLNGPNKNNWQNHEHVHDKQAAFLGPSYLPTYGACAVLGWAYGATHPDGPTSSGNQGDAHDWNPLEIWALGAENPDPSGDRSPWSPILWGLGPFR
jgi:hypothetical protein